MQKITVLTSSRADFGILKPLIRKLEDDRSFDTTVVAFGMHTSSHFGNTVKEIEAENYSSLMKLAPISAGGRPETVAENMGATYKQFSEVWKKHSTDLIICLGDRYEMFAAAGASVPFNIPIAHISGGEVTEGAIDDIYRNTLSLMATYHFASTDVYKQNIIRLKGTAKHVYNSGALSIDSLKQLRLYTKQEFLKKFNIDLSDPYILITFHPETVSFQKNEKHIREIIAALNAIKNYRFVITMPNADTMSEVIRKALNDFVKTNRQAVAVESFGHLGYLSCMKHCAFMLGNTSSGFVEASYFPKPVINLGDRQKGRIAGSHMIGSVIKKQEILAAVKRIEAIKPVKENIYGNGKAAEKIIRVLKKI